MPLNSIEQFAKPHRIASLYLHTTLLHDDKPLQLVKES